MASGTIKIGETLSLTAPAGIFSASGYIKNGVVFIVVGVNARASGWFTGNDIGLPSEYNPSREVAVIGIPTSNADASKISYGFLGPGGKVGFNLSQATSNVVNYTFVYPV